MFVQWQRVRSKSSDLTEEILRKHIVIYSSEAKATIENIMNRYGIVAAFVSNLNYDPQLLQCADSEMNYLATFVQSISANLNPQPKTFISIQFEGQKRYCQFETNPNSYRAFTLYYMYDLEVQDDPYLHVRSYSWQTDFGSWQPFNQGTSVADYSKAQLNFSYMESLIGTSGWITRIPLLSDLSLNSVQTLTVFSTTINTDTNVLRAYSSVSLRLSDLAKELSRLSVDKPRIRYVLLTLNNTVLIESTMGAILPTSIEEGVTRYPKLNDINSSLWSQVSNMLNTIQDGNVSTFMDNDITYLLVRQPIIPNNMSQSFIFLACFPLDFSIENVILPMSTYFVIGLAVIIVGAFLGLFLIQKNEERRKRKLSKRTQLLNLPYDSNNYVDDHGIVPRSIHQIRNLELLYPDDITLNKVLDGTVESLSSQKEKIFTLKNVRCEFCEYLSPKSLDFIDDPREASYTYWRELVYPTIKFKFSKFPVDQFIRSPNNLLIRYMITILYDNKLLIPPFDPDCLLHFFLKIEFGIVNPVHAALMIFSLRHLIFGPFNYWITNKVDILILFFAAYFTQFSSKNYNINKRHFLNENSEEVSSNETERMSFYPISNSKEVYEKAFNDSYSITEDNIKTLYRIFIETVPVSENDKIFHYFWKGIKKILFSHMYSKQFELLGEIRVRVQSHEFSVHTDYYDRLLFMKSILKLCDLCDYWSSEYIMLKTLQIADNIFFSEEENKDKLFIATFHYEFTSKMVLPWISLFTGFKQLDDITENGTKTLEYWENLMNSLHPTS